MSGNSCARALHTAPIVSDFWRLPVSRKHAVLVQKDGRWLVEDGGSLNGTFVNRKRVETAELDDGDELQIGKYRMTFLKR